MRKNLKIHAIAITSICVLVTIIYTLVTPTPTASTQPQGDRAIAIYSATWGSNCNTYIAKYNADRQNFKSTAAKGEQPIAPPPALKPVQTDNVLTAVSNTCNDKLTCTINADSETLGTEPVEGCFKHLTVRYRCFEYDRAWEVNTDQGKPLDIDCNASPAPTPKQ